MRIKGPKSLYISQTPIGQHLNVMDPKLFASPTSLAILSLNDFYVSSNGSVVKLGFALSKHYGSCTCTDTLNSTPQL